MLRLSVLLLTVFSLSIIACNKDDNSAEVENFVDSTLLKMEEGRMGGKRLCYELIFPVTVNFVDGTTADVESKAELKDAIRSWKEANPDATERPELAFPISLLDEEGNVIEVANQEELIALKSTCRGRPHHHWKRCFSIVFPVSIDFPDGTTGAAESKEELRAAMKAWKEANMGANERPHLAFPLTLELVDGTEVTVESKEEMHALKHECKNG
jgi:hypothetical protein